MRLLEPAGEGALTDLVHVARIADAVVVLVRMISRNTPAGRDRAAAQGRFDCCDRRIVLRSPRERWVAQLDAMDGGLVNAATGRRLRAVGWVQRHPLAVCMPVQAVLLFTDLGRLPVWGDEQSSLTRAVLGLVPEHTVHPELYFLLLRGWLSVWCDGPCIVGARALSALCLLAATVAVDRSWLRALAPRERAWFLILWTLSPALLLYGRMARSYSLQLLLACLALYAGSRYAQRATAVVLLAYAALTALLLQIHYLPGIAVVTGVFTAMGWRGLAHRRPAALWPALLAPAVIGLISAPWLPRVTGAVELVAQHRGYDVVGRVADVVLALAYTAVSFSVGESVWPWMIAALLALVPVLAIVLLRGLRAPPAWLGVVAPVAVVAFVGASRWVSYAFVAPRLLFLLPFYLLLLVRGARRCGGLGTVACGAVALLSIGGAAAYFEETGFLNKAYVLPSDAIADAIRAGADDGPVTVVLDHYSSDLTAVAARLPRAARVLYVIDAASAAQAVALAAEPGLRAAWFVHSAHDVSADGWNAMVTDAFAQRFSMRRTGFARYSTLDRWLMRLAGWPQRPHYAIELVQMQYAGGNGP